METIDITYFDLIQQGGIVMILLGICSIISLAIMLERFYKTRASRFINRYIFNNLINALNEKKQESVQEILKNDTFFLGSYLIHITEKISESKANVQSVIDQILSRISDLQEERLHVLPFIIQLAPLLGILGTVIGLTDAFLSLGEMSGGEKFQFLAQGIGKALGTTIAGLIIAVFTMAGHYILKYRNSKTYALIKMHLEKFCDVYQKSL